MKCYVCGRTENDMGFLIDDAKEALEKEIAREREQLQNAEEEFIQQYGSIASMLETVDSKYRDISLKAITSEKAFGDLIPNLEEILSVCKKHPQYSIGKTINALIEQAKVENGSSVREHTARIAALEGSHDKLRPSDIPFYTWKIQLGNLFRALGGSVPQGMYHTWVDAALCPVCFGVISNIADTVAGKHTNSY